jgi:hypothetical protein
MVKFNGKIPDDNKKEVTFVHDPSFCLSLLQPVYTRMRVCTRELLFRDIFLKKDLNLLTYQFGDKSKWIQLLFIKTVSTKRKFSKSCL